MSDFSGSLVVISVKSETVWNRRPAEVGLRLLTDISDSKQVDGFVGGELDQSALGVLAATEHVAGPLDLALAVHRVHGQHPNTEDVLDGVADLALGGSRVHLERVSVGLLDEVV